jgi:regulatory protein
MRIDALAARADRAGRHIVTFSDGSVLRLYRRTIEDFGLYVGLELSDEEMVKLQTAAEKMSAKMRAVRIVAASNVSKTDLEQRLIRKGENQNSAREAVQWMEDLNLVNDEETARQLVQQCVRKGYGVARAKQALYEKRIPKNLWEDALADYPDMTDAITAYLRSHLQGAWDQKQQKKVVDALVRRGHTYSQISRALRTLDLDTDEFPEEF